MKKVWTILLCVALCVGLCACGETTFEWSEVVLSTVLPEPPTNEGEVHSNTAKDLWLDVTGLTDAQVAEYIAACKAMGYAIDVKEDTTTFDAYNEDGYKLRISYYRSMEEMSIDLEAPMEMGDILWPTGAAGDALPEPKSSVGKFSFENEDGFFVYIGNTTREEYADYVAACAKKGFDVDYRKGEDYYYADNSEGWSVAIRYEGNNVMSIDVDAPSKETTATTAAESTNKAEIDPTFQAAMDSYEAFMDEYVAFMKKYQADPTNLSLLQDYAEYMSKYADCVAVFEEWEDEELNAAETAYYIDVQARVSKKLLEVVS